MARREAGASDEVLYADLDAELVDEVRAGDGGGHTYFVDRRPKLYGEICGAPGPDQSALGR